MRRLLKGAAETVLVSTGLGAASRRRRRRQVVVLAWHDVIPHGERPCGDRSLHLPQAVFAAQLDRLAATHDVVPLASLHLPGDGRRPRAAITFDDAYRGAVTAGVGEVVRRGLPATIFVAPGLFGTATWWDRIAERAGGVVPGADRERALAVLAGAAERIHAEFGEGADMPQWARIASEAEVRAAGARPGITLEAHSWSHPNLAALDAPALAEELERPRAWLRDAGRTGAPWLAFPYGRTSAAVAAASAAAGYEGAFRIDGGWLRASSPPYDLPRLNVPAGLSRAGFALRADGLVER